MNFIAPSHNQKTIEVPVSLEYEDEPVKDGITRKTAILQQTKVALEILKELNPERILTLGGECSRSVPNHQRYCGKL